MSQSRFSIHKLIPQQTFQQIVQNETFEPAWDWGLRMGIAATLPVVWGTVTSHVAAASWITLTAESISWVELKGSFGTRLRVLIGGALLTSSFAFLGSVTAGNIWLSVVAMLLVALLSGLFKNLGDRGSGLAISVYVMFLIANAYPTKGADGLQDRMILTAIGGVWALVVGIAASAFIPAQAPYRRTIALIWKANAALVHEVKKGWDGKTLRAGMRSIYQKEKAVRVAIDHSLHFYESLAHQVSKRDRDEYHLAQIRKITALVATHVEAIGGELELIRISEAPASWRSRVFDTLHSLERTMERFAIYMLLFKPEEELLLLSRLDKLKQNLVLLQEQQQALPDSWQHLKRVQQLLDRTTRLMETAMKRLQEAGHNHSLFHPYPLMKSLVMLHPAQWQKNIRLLFDPNMNTMRYAIRSALAATLALFLYKFFDIAFGYWIPFTVLLVMQPHLGATIKKAIDRVIGTVAGVIVGGIFVGLPTGLYLVEVVLFLSFVLMIYFLRKNYAVAAFFITLSLVLLFDVEQAINVPLIVTRVLATLGGSCLAIIAGFLLLPTWDRKWLPIHLGEALTQNYQYFVHTFYLYDAVNWTRMKRLSETSNSNAYDSFTRYMQEPGTSKKRYVSYFQLISHNVRVTRLLNNINIELDARQTENRTEDVQRVHHLIEGCKTIFDEIIGIIKDWSLDIIIPEQQELPPRPDPDASLSQQQYLERLLQELKVIAQDLNHLEQATPQTTSLKTA